MKNKSKKVWIGTPKEFGEHRFRIIDEHDIVVIGGYAVGKNWQRVGKYGKPFDIGAGILVVWDEVEI